VPDAPALRADCSRCFALCCVAHAFAASADFAHDKAAGEPCHHLRRDFACGIHDRLREEGYRGCTSYDCYGAGQHVSQVTFGGVDWRTDPTRAPRMFAVLPVVRALNELRWLLTEALVLDLPRPLRDELTEALAATEDLVGSDAEALARLDVDAHRGRVNPLLRRASERARAGTAPPALSRDLLGADLRGRDLRGADLRGALLVAADLRGADLRKADLTGADLRDADLCGADLRGSLFLAQPQVDAARGDARTRLPEGLNRPAGWPVR
jgi:uncharacterized protein YjbI with pentapeptide repeats